MKGKKTSWGPVADWYDELLEQSPGSYQESVILPNIIRIVDPKHGMSVLDVACGQGYFLRAFHEKGAVSAGSDISKELIDLAQKRSPRDIRYFVSPSDDLSFAKDGTVDVASIILSIQNIEAISEAFAECARVLKPNGRLVIVLNHPAFRIPKRSSWQWDDKAQTQYRRVDGYMSESHVDIDMTPGETRQTSKKFTVSFHRPLQVYFKELSKNGFSITRLEEWISHKQSQAGPRSAAEDRIRKEIPMFLCLEAKKSS